MGGFPFFSIVFTLAAFFPELSPGKGMGRKKWKNCKLVFPTKCTRGPKGEKAKKIRAELITRKDLQGPPSVHQAKNPYSQKTRQTREPKSEPQNGNIPGRVRVQEHSWRPQKPQDAK